jgi:hypothetical protein
MSAVNNKKNPLSLILCCLVLLGSVGMAFVTSSHAESQNQAVLIPKPNDLFVVDYNKLFDKQQEYGYSLLKIKSIHDQKIEFYISKLNYNQLQGPVKDIESQKIQDKDYFSTETISINSNLMIPLESDHTLYPVAAH